MHVIAVIHFAKYALITYLFYGSEYVLRDATAHAMFFYVIQSSK